MPPQAQGRTVIQKKSFKFTIAVMQRAEEQGRARKVRDSLSSHGTANNKRLYAIAAGR